MRGFRRLALLALVCSLFLPAVARAQNASIAGVVKDASGAVLPGVTVEVTEPGPDREDANGRHRRRRTVQDRQPPAGHLYGDVYAERLQHLQARRHRGDGHVRPSTVNGDMKVGAVAETITVTGETPLVDVQSATVQKSRHQGSHRQHSDRPARDQPRRASAGHDPRRDERQRHAASATRMRWRRRTSAARPAIRLPTCRSTAARRASSGRRLPACRPRPSSASASRSARRRASPRCRRCRSTAPAPTRRWPAAACG